MDFDIDYAVSQSSQSTSFIAAANGIQAQAAQAAARSIMSGSIFAGYLRDANTSVATAASTTAATDAQIAKIQKQIEQLRQENLRLQAKLDAIADKNSPEAESIKGQIVSNNTQIASLLSQKASASNSLKNTIGSIMNSIKDKLSSAKEIKSNEDAAKAKLQNDLNTCKVVEGVGGGITALGTLGATIAKGLISASPATYGISGGLGTVMETVCDCVVIPAGTATTSAGGVAETAVQGAAGNAEAAISAGVGVVSGLGGAVSSINTHINTKPYPDPV